MAVTVGSLRVDMTLDSAQFQAGAAQATRSMSGLQAGTQQLQRSANSFNFRGLTQQLSQVGQQIAATGLPLQAFAVQAADIGLAFGPWGVVLGTVAGLALPTLVSALGGGQTALERFNDAAKAADDALSDFNSTVNSISGLQRDYREAVEAGNEALAEQIRLLIKLRQNEAELQQLQLPRLIREQEEALRELTRAQEDQRQAVEEAAAAAQDALEGRDRGQFEIALTLVEELRAEYELVAEEAAVAANQTEQLKLEAQIAAAQLEDMSNQAESVATAALTMPPAFNAASGAAGGIASALAAAATSAWDAVSAALTLANIGRTATAQLGDDERGSQRDVRDMSANGLGDLYSSRAMAAAAQTAAQYARSLRDVDAAASGGGGGGGGAAGAVQELASVADTLDVILRDAADPVQDFRDNMMGIAEDAIDGLGDAFGDFLASGMSDFDSFADALVNTAADAVAGITAEFAAGQIGGMFGGPVGGFLGSIVGGLFGGLFGGGGGSSYEGSDQQQIDQQKADLIRQIHELEGHSNYLKRQEIKNLDESNRALGRRLQSLEEEAALAAEQARIADERMSLQMQLWELEGNTEAIRAAQLEALDESNRALQEEIWAQEDLAAATAEAEQAINDLVNSINPSDFSTQFAYDRAIALAKTGVVAPVEGGAIPAPVAGDPAATQAAETASLSAEVRTMSSRINELLKLAYGWDTEGLPTVAA